MSCTCHDPLWTYLATAWSIRRSTPLTKGVRAGVQLWWANRKDRHTGTDRQAHTEETP